MRTSGVVLALICGAAGTPAAPGRPDPFHSPALALVHVDVVDVRAGRVLADRTVLVEQGRIAGIGPADSLPPPAGATIVDGRGRHLIPGLWDMHVHAAWPGIDRAFAPLFVANGVTGVREMFGDLRVIRAWKARYSAGGAWPRLVASGHILDGPQPFWPGSVVAATAANARHAVDSLRAAGADFIKVYTRLPREAYLAAVDEAKRIGISVVGHVPDAVSVTEASDLGQRSVEHLTGVALDCSRDAAALRAEPSVAIAGGYAHRVERILATQDSTRCAHLIVRLARNRTWQVPTLVELRAGAYLDDERFTADPRVRYMPPDVVQRWNRRGDARFRTRTAAGWAMAKRMYRRNLEIVGAMARGGVPILTGTDALNPFSFPGFSLHDELALLVEAGLSPAEALRAATLSPAEFLETSDSMGTVEVGKVADLVLLAGNPLDDIRHTREVEGVVLNGRWYDRAAVSDLVGGAKRKGGGL